MAEEDLVPLEDDAQQEQLSAFGTGMTMSIGVFEVQALWGSVPMATARSWRKVYPPAARQWKKPLKAPSGAWKTRTW